MERDGSNRVGKFIDALDQTGFAHETPSRRYSLPAGPERVRQWSFEAFGPGDFELLIVHILLAEGRYIGCNRFGKSGMRQPGIDLYAYGDTSGEPRLDVYECKRVKEIRRADIEEAFDRFEDRGPLDLFRRFTFVSAGRFESKAHDAYIKWHHRLMRQYGIEVDQWDAQRIWYRLSRLPAVAQRFLSDREVDDLCAPFFEDQRREAELAAFAAAQEKHFARILSEGPVEVVGDAQHEPMIDEGERQIVWDNGIVGFHAFLPDKQSFTGAAGLSIKGSSLAPVTFTFDHRDILEWLLPGMGTALESDRREYLFPAGRDSTAIVVRFRGSTTVVTPPVGQAVCDAVDVVVGRYVAGLRALEEVIGARGFRFEHVEGYDSIVLARVKPELWQSLLEFASAHDVDNGDSEWHIFDASPSMLKVYARAGHPVLNPGYHCVLEPQPLTGSFSHGRRILDPLSIAWRPPFRKSDWCIGPRDYWDAETCLRWLTGDLLEAVRGWLWDRMSSRDTKRLAGNGATATDRFDWLRVRDYRQWDDLSLPKRRDRPRLTEVVHRLQDFYHHADGADPFISAAEYRALLEATQALLTSDQPQELHFASQKLDLEEADDLDVLVDAIGRKIDAIGPGDVAGPVVDLALRVLAVYLEGASRPLSAATEGIILGALEPVIARVSTALLVSRHL